MPEELRDSQRHATLSSLKATHTAHRVASEIFATPTPALREIATKPVLHAVAIRFATTRFIWAKVRKRFVTVPTWGELILLAFIWASVIAVLVMIRAGWFR
jgi:hypothetical protein